MKRDEITIPRRVVFIMLFVSLCINIFFLLMGILIGKDDKKWKEQSVSETGFAQTVEEDNLTRDALENELSLFESESDEERDKPIDVGYLESGFEKPEPAKPKTQPTRQAQQQATTTPEPRPKSDPPPKPPAATGKAYWIQIVASSDRAKADEIRQKAIESGFGAVVITQGAYHKVHVGPYRERDQAGKQISKIKSGLGYDGWIVSR